MHVLIEEDLYDRKFVDSCTIGFEELKEKVLDYPPEEASKICGVSPDMIRDIARRLAATKPAMLCYTLGITEHTCGRNNVVSTANLQMLLGNMGMECGGVNPLRGQNNVQGACDMGALPNVFPGYQKVANPDARAKFEKAWGVNHLPEKAGLMIPQMMDGLVTGKVKAFYIFGENLANTEPDIEKVEHELACAEFHRVPGYFPDRNHPLCACHLSGCRLERKRRHICKQRAPGQPGQGCQPPAGRSQTQLVDLQADRQTHGPGLAIRQRP